MSTEVPITTYPLKMTGLTEADLTPGSIWLHHQTQTFWVIGGVAVCSTNGERDQKERSVVYYNPANPVLEYREVSEFLDGRFAKFICPERKET